MKHTVFGFRNGFFEPSYSEKMLDIWGFPEMEVPHLWKPLDKQLWHLQPFGFD